MYNLKDKFLRVAFDGEALFVYSVHNFYKLLHTRSMILMVYTLHCSLQKIDHIIWYCYLLFFLNVLHIKDNALPFSIKDFRFQPPTSFY